MKTLLTTDLSDRALEITFVIFAVCMFATVFKLADTLEKLDAPPQPIPAPAADAPPAEMDNWCNYMIDADYFTDTVTYWCFDHEGNRQ